MLCHICNPPFPLVLDSGVFNLHRQLRNITGGDLTIGNIIFHHLMMLGERCTPRQPQSVIVTACGQLLSSTDLRTVPLPKLSKLYIHREFLNGSTNRFTPRIRI